MRASHFLLAASSALVVKAQSGNGYSTRYWDCCKGVCSWSGVAAVANPAAICDKNDNPFTDYNAADGCDGGNSFMCSNYSPFGISNDLAYGFAGVNIVGKNETTNCCACYKLTFTSGAVQGKSIVVQALSTSYNEADNQFDILIPGSGVGATSGCSNQWGDVSQWGAQYGGVSTRDGCAALPQKLRGGCYWRFDWFRGADNPTVSFQKTSCPKELTDISGCRRPDDGGASPRPSTTSTTAQPVASGQPHYAQCGGRTYTGATKCAGNLQCVFVNDNYYQCLNPGENPPTSTQASNPTTTQGPQTVTITRTRTRPTTAPTTSTVPQAGRDPAAYEQCGGLNYNGTNHCPTGFTCAFVDQWYSQCVQSSGGSVAQPGTTNCGSRCTTALPPTLAPSVITLTSTYIVTTVVTSNSRVTSIPQTTQTIRTTTVAPSAIQTIPANPASSGVAQLYEQCYGSGWQGPTRCTTGLVCIKVDDFYGQCQKPS